MNNVLHLISIENKKAMEINNWVVFLAAFIPTIVGFIWYNSNVMGMQWKRAANLRDNDLKKGNMGVRLGIAFILSLMLAFYMPVAVIHQWSIYSLMMNDLTSSDPIVVQTAQQTAEQLMVKYATEFRTFKHGMLHGFMLSLFVVFPVTATNAMYEQRSWKHIFINMGYWTISIMLMGGVICQWA